MLFVWLIKLHLRSFTDGLSKRQAGGNHQGVVFVSGDSVLLCQLSSHFRRIFVSPCHEKSWPGAMLYDDVGLFLGVFVKNTHQFRMNGALAAIGHDDCIELLARFIENNLVVADRRIFSAFFESQVRFHVMPVETRSADRYRCGTISPFV